MKLPDEVSDDQAILLSDIFPTGYFGADLAEIKPGDTVARLRLRPGRPVRDRSAPSSSAPAASSPSTRSPTGSRRPASRGPRRSNFDEEDPVETIKELTAASASTGRSTPSASTPTARAARPQSADDEAVQRGSRGDRPRAAPARERLAAGRRPLAGARSGRSRSLAKAGTLSHHRRLPADRDAASRSAWRCMKNLTIRWATATTASTSRGSSS